MKPGAKMAYRLTKTAYLQFLKCPPEFWLQVHEPLMVAEPATLEHEHLRQQGYLVESYVKKLSRFQTNENFFVDFQKTYQTADLTARCDIVVLDRATNEVEIYEIKSSGSVKEEHYDDVAFQKVVAERSGVKVSKVGVVTLNTEYIRQGEIDPEQLFDVTDLTAEAELRLTATEDSIRQAFEYLRTVPAASLADYCTDQKLNCHYLKLHFENLPDHTVFDLVYLKHEKRRELLRNGIIDIVDIPDDYPLSDKQDLQVKVAKSGVPLINRREIAERMATWAYPLHFLDYETFAYAVPQFDGIKPFQQMVFQYSLHTIDRPGAEPRHQEYLSKGDDELALSVARHLRDSMGEIGTVLVWYEAFEKGRNEEMAAMFPEVKDFFEQVNAKTVDLMKVFSDNLLVHPAFKGRTSIKKVLPVLAPDLDYKALGIGDGLSATIKWFRATTWKTMTETEREQIYNDLLEYCGLDTMAMVRIFYELHKAVASGAEQIKNGRSLARS